jgi:hypothetical protein
MRSCSSENRFVWREMTLLGGSRDGHVSPMVQPRKEFGAGGPEVGIDNRRRRVSIGGAGNGTINKAR